MEKQEMKRFYPEPDPNDVAPASGLISETHSEAEIPHSPVEGLMGRAHRGPLIPNVNRIPTAFQVMDNDLAAENLEDHFDMTPADLQDLQG